MKASVKFRDQKQPLARTKIPISILGLPFLTGISAGDSKELRLHLGTAFESGPAIRFCFHPNDQTKPFSVIFKAKSFSTAISAEFNLLSGKSPSFSIQIKPNLGDFFLRKSHLSTDFINESFFINSDKKPLGFDLISGSELTVKSVLPIRHQAAVNFCWGLRVPEFSLDYADRGISKLKLPVLVLSKISVEQVRSKSNQAELIDLSLVEKEIRDLQRETGAMKKAIGELRGRFDGGDRISAAGVALDD